MPPKRPLPADVDAAWRVHQETLSHLSDWRLSAGLAARTGRDGGQANMEWRQRALDYDIRLAGPFGSGAVRLSGNAEGATLRLANGKRMSDPDPTRLLFEQTGWWLPVDSLRYWAVGLPDPALPSRFSLDEYGRLGELEQDGWKVHFEAYESEGALDLPKRVTIQGHGAELRVVARRWRIELAEAK